MKPIWKRSASLLLAVCMLLTLLPAAVYAGEGTTPSGGPDWVLSDEGKLTIYNDDGMVSWSVAKAVYVASGAVVSVEIGEEVTFIEGSAFEDFSALEEVTFAENSQLTEIGESAFASTGLTAVNIPASVTTIGYQAFQYCSALEEVTFAGTSQLTEIGESAFASTGLTAVNIPASVTTIGYQAFQYCSALEEVTFAGTSQLTEIGESAFASTGLEAVEIPASVTIINNGAFQDCGALEEVTFEGASRLKEIHSYAFASTGFTSVTIPASVTIIDGGVFAACESLGAIGVEPGNNSFVAIDGVLYALGSNGPNVLVAYPAGRDGGAFTIPGGIIQIGASAFQGSKLTGVTIPPTVTGIVDSAFRESDLLEEVTFQRSTPPFYIGWSIFNGCVVFESPGSGRPIIHVPVGAKGAYEEAFALTSTNPEVDPDFIQEPVDFLDVITNEFTDENFRAAIRSYLGKGADDPIYEADVRFLESLDVSGEYMHEGEIQSLAGISRFFSLKKLDCSGNELTTLDLSGLTGLTELNCAGNELTALDLSGLTGLTELDCGGNELTALDLSGLNGLTELYCSGNKLTNLNLPAGLKVLDCSYNGLTALPALPAGLTELYCADNKLTNLNLPSGLEVLYCSYNELTALPALPSGLTELYCSGNKLTNLNLPSGLKVLDCSYNKLTTLNLSGLTGLTQLNYAGTGLTGLNLSGLTHLKVFLCYDNGLTVLPALPAGLTALDCSDNKLTGLDLSGLTHLKVLDCSVNMLTTLDVSGLTGLENLNCSVNMLETLDVNNLADLSMLDCSVNKLTTLDVRNNIELAFLDCSNNYMADYEENTSVLVGYDGMMTGLNFYPQDDPGFIRVTGITGLPAAASVGTPLTLTGTVVPGDAQNRNIEWGIPEFDDGSTGAQIDGNIFTATHAGTALMMAIIPEGLGAGRDYYQSFEITVSAAGVTPDPDPEPTSAPASASTPTPTPMLTPAPVRHHAAITRGGMAGASLTVEVDAASGKAVIGLETLTGELFTRDEAAVISIPAIQGVGSYTLGLPAGALSQEQGKGALTLETQLGSITLAANMLAGMEQAQGKAAAITIGEGDRALLPEDVKAAVGNRPLVQLTLTLDGERAAWNNPEAPVTVSIPYAPTAEELINPESIIIWYIDGSGPAVCVPNGRYDPATGTVTFTTTHFSYYAVAYNKVSFGDVAGNAWYGKAVAFIAARGITSGTGGGNYSPNARLTRAELIVLLMNAYGIAPDKNPADNFSDAGNTWYTGHLAAAKRLGISDGLGNNRFAPDREITRQEMFTLMYNVLKVYGKLPETGDGKTLSEFGDAGDVALWAKDATELFVETGIIEGVDGKLFPADTTTRAEIAQVLYNLLSK